jgi:hypothetical protein
MSYTYAGVTVPDSRKSWVELTREWARRVGYSEDLLVRQVYQESRFNPESVGGGRGAHDPALGIAQILRSEAQKAGIDPTDPNQAIPYMARRMKKHYDESGGSVPRALALYHTGAGNLKRHGLGPVGQKYVSFVNQQDPTSEDFPEGLFGSDQEPSAPAQGVPGGVAPGSLGLETTPLFGRNLNLPSIDWSNPVMQASNGAAVITGNAPAPLETGDPIQKAAQTSALERFGRNAPTFEPPPATSLFKTSALSQLVQGARGFSTGARGASEAGQAREEKTAEKMFRERQLSIQEKGATAEADYRKSVLANQKSESNRAAREGALKILHDNPAIAQSADAAGLNGVKLISDWIQGNLKPEEEAVLGHGIAFAANDASLPPDLQAAIKIRMLALPPNSPPEKMLKLRQTTADEFLKTAGDPISRLKLQMKDVEKDREFKQAQIENLQGSDLRAFAGNIPQDVASAQANLNRAAEMLWGHTQAPLNLQALMNMNPDSRDQALASTSDSETNKGAKDILRRAIAHFEGMQALQRSIYERVGKAAGVEIPAAPTLVPETTDQTKPQLLPLNPPSRAESSLGRETTISKATSTITGTLGRLSRGMKFAMKTPFGVSDIDKAADASERINRILDTGDERSLRSLASAINLTNIRTGETIEATSEEKIEGLKAIISKYPRDEVVEYVLRRAIGDEAYESLVTDYASDPSSIVSPETFLGPDLTRFLESKRTAPK